MELKKNIENAPAPIGPYSIAVESRGMLYLSGQIGIDPATSSLVTGGVEYEIKQVLKNIDAILFSSKISSSNVVFSSIFLTEMSDFKIVNEVYSKWVNIDQPPARQTVAVKELPAGAKVEISVIAELSA